MDNSIINYIPPPVTSPANLAVLDGRYLKLDQTVQQYVINGNGPEFNTGLVIKSGQKLYFDG